MSRIERFVDAFDLKPTLHESLLEAWGNEPPSPPSARTKMLRRIEDKLDRILALLEKPKRAKQANKAEYTSEFRLLWAMYPMRAGSNPKLAAFHALQARLKAGEAFDAIKAGVERYKAFCVATGTVGTGYVMQAARFFGPEGEWGNEWAIPKSTALPKTEEEWYALARARNVPTKPGESWDGFKRRIMEAK